MGAHYGGIIVLFGLLILAGRNAGAQSVPANLDFEQGKAGQFPAGWHVPGASRTGGYTAKITMERPHKGKQCALLTREKAAESGTEENAFGNIMQTFDALSYRGKRVRFRAAVRMEQENRLDRAQLWLRVDCAGDRAGLFDNMSDRPITSARWQFYEIMGDVEPDAQRINLGLILLGGGKAWLDTASFEVIGNAGTGREPARPLTGRGLENLVAYTRLLGYIRHFHPSDQGAETDWNRFAIMGVRQVEDAKDADELARRLETFFCPIAPTVQVFSTGQPPPHRSLTPPPNTPGLRIISWRHVGFGTGAPQSIYSSRRIRKAASNGKPLSPPYAVELGGGVSCRVPLELYADGKGTLPHVPAPPPLSAILPSGDDRATRLADVALAWNVFQHFYPYFDVVQADWPAALRNALTSAATDPDALAFLTTLRHLIVALRDGHGNVNFRGEQNAYALPIIWRWIEEKLVIIQVVPEGAEELQRGDIVLKLDGKPADEVVAAQEDLVSGATPQWRRFRAAQNLEDGPQDSEVVLEVQHPSGEIATVKVRRSLSRARVYQEHLLAEARPQQYSEIRPGIYYLDVSRIKQDELAAALPQLADAKGVICDLRGYPSGEAMALLGFLADKPITSAQWCVPVITQPDGKNWKFSVSRWSPIPPAEPHIKGKVAFLTDGRAISYAESYMGIIENYKLAEIVGETTAGTNGNINPFVLPGGYRLIFTGMKVLKHDGSQHHGVGIHPTITVAPTVQGVVAGRDEVLERAIEVVSK